ncbi:unnamed protein product [Prorocentrum cordatum]|uniref:Uncharacterized protein n=1 Tax=Prorocentrum cordatum TaxID=2364126 RepID=A0ABN9XZG1_9DINO|nr:unnamed protein product [Polarella glacialis]
MPRGRPPPAAGPRSLGCRPGEGGGAERFLPMCVHGPCILCLVSSPRVLNAWRPGFRGGRAIGGRDAPPGPRPSVIEPPTAWRSEAAPTRTDAVPRLADITGSEESSRCLAMHPSGFGLRALCAALLGAWPAASGYAPPTKYLLVSDAVNGNIAYAKLTSPGVAGQMTPLITKGLVHPQDDEYEAVGPYSAEVEGVAGRLWRQLLIDHHMCACDSFYSLGPIFFWNRRCYISDRFHSYPTGVETSFREVPNSSSGRTTAAGNQRAGRPRWPPVTHRVSIRISVTVSAVSASLGVDWIMASLTTWRACAEYIEHILASVLGMSDDDWMKLCTKAIPDEVYNSIASLMINS